MDTEQTPLSSGFGPQTTAEEVATGIDLRGKIVVITGGYAGLGLETTRVLAAAGGTVVVGARDLVKAGNALGGLSGVEVAPLDLADPGSIDRFAGAFIGAGSRTAFAPSLCIQGGWWGPTSCGT